MAQRSIDITQINAGIGNNGNTLVVQGNTLVFAASGASSSFTGNTTNVPEGANLYFTNTRALTAVNGFINTSNVVESSSNLYFTNTRVIAAVKDNISTSNVIEGSNLYFTNTRSIGSLTAGAGININANGLLTITAAFSGNTNAVPEGSANLYFTNTRVIAAVKDNINTSNVIEGSNLYFTNTRAIYALTPGNNITIAANGLISGASQAFSGNTNAIPEGSANLYFSNTRAIAAVKDNINTSNVIEGANLYFTNTRAIAAVKDNINTSNVIEGANLYFTNTRAISALTPGNNITIAANGLISGASQAFSGNTNAVPEGSANLYFTNTRAISSLTAGQNIVIAANGLIGTTKDQTIGGNLTIQGNLLITGNIAAINVLNLKVSDNMIYLNSNSTISNPDIGFAANYNDGTYAHTGLFRDATDGRWKFFDKYAPEPDADIYIDTANVTFNLANVQAGTFFGSGAGLTNIPGTSFSGNTNSIPEGSANLYFTNTRVIAAVKDNISTSNVIEGSNLYFTNTRSISSLTAGQNIVIAANGLISGASQVFSGNTNIVPEGSANLYFTNTRAISALTAGSGIVISAGGTITANVVTIIDSEIFFGSNANLTMATSISNPKNIIVVIDGLVQIPTIDYTVSGTSLRLSSNTAANSTVEVKYYGNDALSTSILNPFLLAGL